MMLSFPEFTVTEKAEPTVVESTKTEPVEEAADIGSTAMSRRSSSDSNKATPDDAALNF
jgi:hypothetical protein